MSVAPLRSCSVMNPLKRETQRAKRPFGVVSWPSRTRGMSRLVSPAGALRGERAQASAQRDLLHHFQVVALQAHDLLRVVGQQPETPEPEILEDLRTDAEFSQPAPVALAAAVVLLPVGAGEGGDRTHVLVEVHQHAPPFLGDGAESLVQLL